MLNRLFSALENTRSSISNAFKGLSGNNISDDNIEQIEEKLLLADIGFDTVENIIKIIRKFKNDNFLNEIKNYLLTELPQKQKLVDDESFPLIIMLVGVNGTGKTTSAAKLAKLYKDLGSNVTLVAADTYRAAAIEQLRVWSKRANTTLVYNEKATEPSAVLFDGLTSALSNHSDIVIVDTAGRLHTYENLMSELEKMYRISTTRFPQFKVKNIITIDSLLGQNSIVQAEEFNKHVPLDGAILTKLDGTAKGGIVFSLHKKLNLPVQYIGVGEGLSDIEVFDPEKYIDGLFGIENNK